MHIVTFSFLVICRVASTVDAVLLSYPDTMHLGALPYAMKQFGLSAPVYATEPVYRLGLLTMYDHYLSRKVKCNSLNFPLKLIYIKIQCSLSEGLEKYMIGEPS